MTPLSNRSLIEIDRDHLIHPVMSFRGHEKAGARILESGDGMWLTDIDGRRMIDAFAGLWCVNVGYGQDSIVDVAAEQMRKLPYATGFFGFACESAIRLAGELTALAPAGLDHVYFTLGGSDAVDSAIRYIVHYMNATGRPEKKHFIAQVNGYHGSSSMGAGLTALPHMQRGFDVPLGWQHHIPSPFAYRHPAGDDPQALIAASVAALEAKVAELGGPDKVAAFFCEPVQGSGGVIVPPVGWLKAMRAACTRLDILMVADEVITGFGRTGPLFACNTEGVSPDLMTMAKGLTGGYMPMGAVMMADHVYQGIADGADPSLPIGHGYTYSAHPVSAAVALECLRLYQSGLLANGERTGARFSQHMEAIKDHPLVGDVRWRGLLGAIELVNDKAAKTNFAYDTGIAAKLAQITWDEGLLVRCFANGALGFAPALCCTEGEMDDIFHRVHRTLDKLLDYPEIRAAMA
ncbi:MAG: hypothetical protein RIS94_855 [Pseudomonadota bacterium]|jgi:adenosylmethionine-8-amino-7-oxononanoate aminotransferase